MILSISCHYSQMIPTYSLLNSKCRHPCPGRICGLLCYNWSYNFPRHFSSHTGSYSIFVSCTAWNKTILSSITYAWNVFARHFCCVNQLSPTWEASGKLPTTTWAQNEFQKYKDGSTLLDILLGHIFFELSMQTKMPSCIDHVLSFHSKRIHDLIWVIQDYCVIKLVHSFLYILVGGWATPLKNMNVNWDDEIPNIWENKKCSKPPTSITRYYYILFGYFILSRSYRVLLLGPAWAARQHRLLCQLRLWRWLYRRVFHLCGTSRGG